MFLVYNLDGFADFTSWVGMSVVDELRERAKYFAHFYI